MVIACIMLCILLVKIRQRALVAALKNIPFRIFKETEGVRVRVTQVDTWNIALFIYSRSVVVVELRSKVYFLW